MLACKLWGPCRRARCAVGGYAAPCLVAAAAGHVCVRDCTFQDVPSFLTVHVQPCTVICNQCCHSGHQLSCFVFPQRQEVLPSSGCSIFRMCLQYLQFMYSHVLSCTINPIINVHALCFTVQGSLALYCHCNQLSCLCWASQLARGSAWRDHYCIIFTMYLQS